MVNIILKIYLIIMTSNNLMMKIVKDSGYTGFVDVEYEGSELSEQDGIIATKNLLEKVFKTL